MSISTFVKNAIALGVARYARDAGGNISGLTLPNGNTLGLDYTVTERNVATGCRVNFVTWTGAIQSMSRSKHVARSEIKSLRLLYGNWYARSGAAEIGTGEATYTASIEYPAGTFTQVKFSGSASGVCASAGEIFSDYIAVSIPVGKEFWVRTYVVNAGGCVYSTPVAETTHGEAIRYGATQADLTMGGTVTNTGSGLITPQAILSYSSVPSIYLAGDSRISGYADSAVGAKTIDKGIVARSIGNYPYINAGVNSDYSNATSLSFDTKRLSLATRFCTHVITSYGINDLVAGTAAATIHTRLQTHWAAFGALPVYQCTIPPVSTSTDSWATVVNQTTVASNAARVTLNGLIRSSLLVDGVFEVADQVESARDSGLWKAAYTGDGTHENVAACTAIKLSGAVKFMP